MVDVGPSPHRVVTYKALEGLNALAEKEHRWVSFDFDQLPIADDGNVYKVFLITQLGGASDPEGFRVCILLNDAGATCWLDMHMRTWSSLPEQKEFEKTGKNCNCAPTKEHGNHYPWCWGRRYYMEIVKPGLTQYKTVKGRLTRSAWPQEKEQEEIGS